MMTQIPMDPRFNSGLDPATFSEIIMRNPPRQGEGSTFYTGAVRLSFPQLVEKKSAVVGSEPKFGAVLLYHHKNVAVPVNALRNGIRAKFPNINPDSQMNFFDRASPIRDQGLKVTSAEGGNGMVTYAGYVPGYFFLSPKSKNMIECMARKRGVIQKLLPSEIGDIFYAGCWVNAKINVFNPATQTGGPAFFGLQGLMFLADDTPFGEGGGIDESDFADAYALDPGRGNFDEPAQWGNPQQGQQPAQWGNPQQGQQPAQWGNPQQGQQPAQWGNPQQGQQPAQWGNPQQAQQQADYGDDIPF